MEKKKKITKKIKKVLPKKEKTAKPKAEVFSSKIPMLNSSGKSVGIFELDEKLFNGFVNKELLYQAINMYQANLRQGNASTKNRSEVRGGGKKPWRQKGTGRARVGSIRNPIWKGGGVVFGPRPKEYGYDIPKKMKKIALLSSLNAKLRNNEIVLVDEIKLEKPKTKLFVNIMKALKITNKPLFIIDSSEDNLRISSGNIPNLKMKNFKDINAYDVLKSNEIVLSKKVITLLQEDLRKI